MTESNIDRHMAHQIAFTTKSKEIDAPENYTATVITKKINEYMISNIILDFDFFIVGMEDSS